MGDMHGEYDGEWIMCTGVGFAVGVGSKMGSRMRCCSLQTVAN